MKRILFAIVLLSLCASCQKNLENAQETVNAGFVSNLKVTATIDAASKVSYTENPSTHALKPSWEVNDKIIGFGSDGKKYGLNVTEVNDGRAKLELITSGEYAGTATADPEDGTIMYMFYAPGAVMDSIHVDKKEFTVSIKEQGADVVPAVMMAQATVKDGCLALGFKNELSIIGINAPTMAAADRTYTSISLFGTGVNTEVKFGLDPEGKLFATPQTPGRINKSMSLTSDGSKATTGMIYIVTNPIADPAKLTFLADNGEYLVKENQTLVRGNYYYMVNPAFTPVPANALPGGFSIKDANGVISIAFFSKGNLYAKDNTSTDSSKWTFEDNQYDFRTIYNNPGCINGSSTSSKTPNNNWGFLGWSTDAAKNAGGRHKQTKASNAYTGGSFKDWGGFIDQKGTWETLTREQWKWVIGPKDALVHNKEARECSTVNGVKNARYVVCRIKVYGKTTSSIEYVNGLMLFPDVFTWPEGLALPPASKINVHTGAFKDVTYTMADFNNYLKNSGVVFLPARGYRNGSTFNSSTSGLYWSATQNDTATVAKDGKRVRAYDKVFALYFMDEKGVGEGSFDSWDGMAVRLVALAKDEQKTE